MQHSSRASPPESAPSVNAAMPVRENPQSPPSPNGAGRRFSGYNEQTWLDPWGNPHTDKLHVIERFSRPNLAVLHYEATIDDPGAYTRSWTTGWDVLWTPNGELMEYICQENNRYTYGFTGDDGRPPAKK